MDNNIPMDDDIAPAEPVVTLGEPPKSTQKRIKINWKVAIIAAVIIVIFVLAYVFKGLLVAATVNGSPIGRLTVIERLEKASGKNLLEALISEKTVSDEAKAKNITVSDEEVETEIKKIETQITAQGSTLDEALTLQGMSRDDLKQQIVFQKQVEKLVADKIGVTDEEVAKYIVDNKIEIPAGQEAVANEQIKSELSNQKLNQAATELLQTLKAQAKIKYFVEY